MSKLTIEEYRIRRGCTIKFPFDSKQEALWALEDMRRRGVLKAGEPPRPYDCEVCGKVHLGHDNEQFHMRQWEEYLQTSLPGVKKYERE